jgi:hypothetical protein
VPNNAARSLTPEPSKGQLARCNTQARKTVEAEQRIRKNRCFTWSLEGGFRWLVSSGPLRHSRRWSYDSLIDKKKQIKNLVPPASKGPFKGIKVDTFSPVEG